MSKAAEYRRRAKDEEALAGLMSRHDYRDYFLDLARQWKARAAAVELEEATLGDHPSEASCSPMSAAPQAPDARAGRLDLVF
jgi:hypothetical protein